MSIADEIQRLQTAKSDIKTAIQNKGVTVPSNAKLDVYDNYITSIPSGTNVSDTTATEGQVLSPEYFYKANGTRAQGTMANNGSLGTTTLTRTTSSKTIPAGYTSGGTVKISTTNLSEGNIKNNVTIVGVTGNFTSDATAGEYDIFDGEIAYVKGNKIEGSYKCFGRSSSDQRNSSSEGCSTTQFVISSIGFEPRGVAIVLNSATYTNNRIIACWAISSAIVYHTKTTSGVARTQITSGVETYWWYDSTNKTVTIKSASSTYLWGSNNYRVFIFR